MRGLGELSARVSTAERLPYVVVFRDALLLGSKLLFQAVNKVTLSHVSHCVQ